MQIRLNVLNLESQKDEDVKLEDHHIKVQPSIKPFQISHAVKKVTHKNI